LNLRAWVCFMTFSIAHLPSVDAGYAMVTEARWFKSLTCDGKPSIKGITHATDVCEPDGQGGSKKWKCPAGIGGFIKKMVFDTDDCTGTALAYQWKEYMGATCWADPTQSWTYFCADSPDCFYIKDTNGTTSASGLCMLEDNLFSKTRATTKCTQNGSHASRTTYVQWDKFCNTAPITTSIINSSTCIEQPCCSSKAVLPTFCPPPWKTSDASSSYSLSVIPVLIGFHIAMFIST